MVSEIWKCKKNAIPDVYRLEVTISNLEENILKFISRKSCKQLRQENIIFISVPNISGPNISVPNISVPNINVPNISVPNISVQL